MEIVYGENCVVQAIGAKVFVKGCIRYQICMSLPAQTSPVNPRQPSPFKDHDHIYVITRFSLHRIMKLGLAERNSPGHVRAYPLRAYGFGVVLLSNSASPERVKKVLGKMFEYTPYSPDLSL
ncbi:hypothetical protein TNCV_3745661 [Trichonephila clavipes]|nr:hypothetical protein TNCV_3745661 [Trichonephila clavipes]